MKLSIFGLGYVGCVCMGCYAELGYDVIGVDVNQHKVELINNGEATIHEEKIDTLIDKNFREGKITATTSVAQAVQNSDISLICVGTPSSANGHLDLNNIYRVCEEIGSALKTKESYHVVIIRSTVLPGTNLKVGEIISSQSAKIRNVDFAVVSNPEFLREASAVDDFFNPEITIIGTDSDKALILMKEISKNINTTIYETDIAVAEIIKLVNNSYHALKVAFANEIGRICKSLSINSHNVMEIFCADKKLNISPAYLMPGFAYGGSCLPKDLKAIKTISFDNYISTPVIDSIDASNKSHINYALNLIEGCGKKKIAVLGLSFKPGTDDLRDSPAVELVERLLGKGYSVRIYDPEVSYSKIVGKNKDFIENTIPHLEKLLIENVHVAVSKAEVIVITKTDAEVIKAISNIKNVKIIDLMNVPEFKKLDCYEGLCW